MILTTPERPIWRIAYIDPDEEGEMPRHQRRVVLYSDYLEVAGDLIIYGRSVSLMPGGEKWGDEEASERTVIERRHLLFMDYAQHHDTIWAEFWDSMSTATTT